MRRAGKAVGAVVGVVALGAVAGCEHFHDPLSAKEVNQRFDRILTWYDYRRDHRDDAAELAARGDWTTARTVDVTIRDHSFVPTYLYLRPNTAYRLSFMNASDRPYTVQARRLFKESAVRVDGDLTQLDALEVAAGETAMLEVLTDQPGQYPLAASGADRWFWGTIGVVEVR